MGKENCVGTYEAYKARLLAMKPNVYLQARSWTVPTARRGRGRSQPTGSWAAPYVMKQCYDTANDPRYADVCTATSHLTGKTINRSTHIHHSMDDLAEEAADDPSDLPPRGRPHAALHGLRRAERPVLRHL